MSQFYCRFLFGIRGWCSTIEEAIDTTSKIRQDLRHEAILFAVKSMKGKVKIAAWY